MRNRAGFLLLIILVVALTPLRTQAQKVENLWRTIVQTPDLSIFTDILRTTGDAALLDKSTPLTVFAPTDAAFEAYFKSLGKSKDDVLADNALKEDIALHHILPGSITPAGMGVLANQNIKVATAVGPDTVAFSAKGQPKTN